MYTKSPRWKDESLSVNWINWKVDGAQPVGD